MFLFEPLWHPAAICLARLCSKATVELFNGWPCITRGWTHTHTHTRIRTNSHTHAAVTNSTLNWTWQPVKCEWSLEILTGKEYSPLIHEGQGFFFALYKKQASSYMYYITSAAAVAVNLYRFPMSNPYRCKRLGTGWSLHAGLLMSWWPMTAKTKKVQ